MSNLRLDPVSEQSIDWMVKLRADTPDAAYWSVSTHGWPQTRRMCTRGTPCKNASVARSIPFARWTGACPGKRVKRG